MREVYLAGVAGNYELCIAAHSGKEHLELSEVGVLCLVQDYAGAVQSTTSHIGEGSYLDSALRHELLKSLWRYHVSECVVKRLKIRIELVLEISRQEAEALTCFYSGSGKDDPLDFPVLQRSDS